MNCTTRGRSRDDKPAPFIVRDLYYGTATGRTLGEPEEERVWPNNIDALHQPEPTRDLSRGIHLHVLKSYRRTAVRALDHFAGANLFHDVPP